MIMITMRMILQWLCLKIHWNNYQVQGSPSLRLGGKNWLLLSREASSPNLQPTAHSCPSLIILIRWYNKDADKTILWSNMMTTMMVFNLRWRRTGARGAPWLLVLSYILSHSASTSDCYRKFGCQSHLFAGTTNKLTQQTCLNPHPHHH